MSEELEEIDTGTSWKVWALSIGLAIPVSFGIFYLACLAANTLAVGLTALVF
jgi:hypothetical protein